MFCSACGAQIQPNLNVCPNCQRPLPSAVSNTVPSRLDRHLHTLGILWVVAGALFVIPGMILTALSSVVRVAIPATETIGRAVAPLVLSLIGGSFLIVAAFGIVVGWGLLKLQPWARTAGIALGVVSLLVPPFGTALGIYTLWVLLSDKGGVEYDCLAQAR